MTLQVACGTTHIRQFFCRVSLLRRLVNLISAPGNKIVCWSALYVFGDHDVPCLFHAIYVLLYFTSSVTKVADGGLPRLMGTNKKINRLRLRNFVAACGLARSTAAYDGGFGV